MNKFLTIFFAFFIFSIFTLGIFPEAFAEPKVSVEDGSVSIDVDSPFHFDLKANYVPLEEIVRVTHTIILMYFYFYFHFLVFF